MKRCAKIRFDDGSPRNMRRAKVLLPQVRQRFDEERRPGSPQFGDSQFAPLARRTSATMARDVRVNPQVSDHRPARVWDNGLLAVRLFVG